MLGQGAMSQIHGAALPHGGSWRLPDMDSAGLSRPTPPSPPGECCVLAAYRVSGFSNSILPESQWPCEEGPSHLQGSDREKGDVCSLGSEYMSVTELGFNPARPSGCRALGFVLY